jgi:predicted Zn-ribbon and HTH transcriptional regulator
MLPDQIDEAVEALLTIDGKGREAKRQILISLLCAPDDILDKAIGAARKYKAVGKDLCGPPEDCVGCGHCLSED